MAETAVVLVAESLLKLLSYEGKIFRGVDKDLKQINAYLNQIKPFLKDAEDKEQVENVKQWVNELRELVFRMEDVLDLHLLKVAKLDEGDGVRGLGAKAVGKFTSFEHRRGIASEIEVIKGTLDGLYKRRIFVDLQQFDGGSLPNETIPRWTPFVEESELIGIEDDIQKLSDWLAKNNCPVLVVVGPAGIGKTTIVKNVYRKQEQKKHKKDFDFCVWITMPQTQADDFKLIRQIKEKVVMTDPRASPSLRSETIEDLAEKLRGYLRDKRCLIVLDDVKELKFWKTIQFAIPLHRVIITTRNANLPNRFESDTSVEVHKLKPLSLQDALKLFHQKVKQVQFPELSHLSKEFVEKCNRVPLAIVAISNLLSTKKSAIEWQSVLDNLGSLLQSNPHLELVQQVMLRSYRDLPSHLRHCFLYFGLFPEGYSISCMRLIRLWVAEGFLKGDTEHKSMEEFGDEYLDELICRGLVHISRVDFDGRPRSCHVYNLMHMIIARICEEQVFSHVMEDRSTPPNSNMDFTHRRLSIIKKKNYDNMKRAEKWEKVRSCFIFDDAKKWQVNNHFFSSFEFLIRLDLSDACLCIDVLPQQVGNLLLMKYLSLRNTNIKSLPKSIGNLVNLQTLDLKQTEVHEVEIKKLVKLRHLLAYYVNNQSSDLDRLEGLRLSKGIQNLESLQKLSFVEATDGSIINGLEKLTKLRKLGIIKLEEQNGAALCKAIEGMKNLCSLSIGALGKQGLLKLQSLRNPPLSLKRLYLYGRLGSTLPGWISKLIHLKRLYLKWSDLKQDPLPYLKDLPELLYLELYDTYEGVELHFNNGWSKLKVLCLGLLPNLKTIKIDKGQVPCLEVLKIGRCHGMITVPRDIQNLKHLQKLYLYDMQEQFIRRLSDMQNGDNMIISKIPLVEYSKIDHFATFHDTDS